MKSKPLSAIKPFFKASVQSDGTLEMMLYGDIVDPSTASMYEAYGITDGIISSATVKRQIDQAGVYSKILVRINSPGGDAFEGIAIGNLLRATKKPIETCVDGVAASAASIIAMAGDTRSIANNAMMMIHNAWSCCCGFATDMRKMADTLDKVSASIGQSYVDRSGKSADEIKALMDAETWMSAEDCVRDGFCTRIAEAPDEQGGVAAALVERFRALGRIKEVPKAPEVPPATAAPVNAAGACECSCAECVAGTCDECTMQGCSDANCKDCPMQESASTNQQAETPAAEASNLSLYEARFRALQLTERV